MKKGSILIVSYLLIVLSPHFGIGQDLSTTSIMEKPKAVLRLGLSSYDRYAHELGLELNYERFMSPRLGVRASLFHSLRLNKSTGVERRTFSPGGLT